MPSQVSHLFRCGPPVDIHARGAIAEVYEVELGIDRSSLESNPLPELLAEGSREQASRIVVKVLRGQHVLAADADEKYATFSAEAQALTRLRGTGQVTPLLAMGYIESGEVSRRDWVAAQLSDSLDEFIRTLNRARGNRWLPFLLLGSVPYEWSLLSTLTLPLTSPNYNADLSFSQKVEIAVETLRLLHRAAIEHDLTHTDLKLEHVAYRDGRLIVIDWNVATVGLGVDRPQHVYLDLRFTFERVLYPLFAGRDLYGRPPQPLWGRVALTDVDPAKTGGMLPFTNVEHQLAPELKAWLSRGFERRENGRAFRDHAEAADSLQDWWDSIRAHQPHWRLLDELSHRCLAAEHELIAIRDTARALDREAYSGGQLKYEVSRLRNGIERFFQARPLTYTGAVPTRPES